MNDSERQTLINNTTNLLNDKDFYDVLKQSLNLLSLSKWRVISLIIFLLITIIPIKQIAFGENTISIFIDIIGICNNAVLAMFAIVFTGYALFQALVSGNALKHMLIQNADKYNMFKEYNLFFFGLIIEYLLLIVINIVLVLVLKSIPSNWICTWFSKFTNEVIATILIAFYVLANVNVLIEVKCFIYNLYQCFSINAFSNVLEELEKNKE